jgi:hypothetical protein
VSRTFGRVGVAVVTATLWLAVGAGSDAAPLQVDEALVDWSIETGPTCPSLHGDSINGGSGTFIIEVEGFDQVVDVQQGQHYVLDLSSPSPDAGPYNVTVYYFDTGSPIVGWQDVQVFCTGATTPFAPGRGVATPGNGSATVSWLAPLWNGGAPIQFYDVTAAAASGGRGEYSVPATSPRHSPS